MIDAVDSSGQSLRGTLIGRGHPDYDDAGKLYNGMIDRRPRLIARRADVAGVIAAVNFGRKNDLRIAIRGRGHNGAASHDSLPNKAIGEGRIFGGLGRYCFIALVQIHHAVRLQRITA